MFQDQIVNITKFGNTRKLKTRQQQKHSLFDALNYRIEEHSTLFKSSSASTRSNQDSEEEKDIIMLKTPQKMCNQQNYFKDDLSITRYNSPERFNPLTQEMELIDKIKTQGKLDALELNLQFETIAENSGIQLNHTLGTSEFMKEFDRCFQMVEALQNTHSLMKITIAELEQKYESNWALEEEYDQTMLFQVYTKEIMENCPVAKSLCQIIGALMNTSLFQHQSQDVIEGLFALASLAPKKFKNSEKTLIKASVLDYKDLLHKINNLDPMSDRIPLILSDGFLDSFKRKQSKSKKQK